MPTAAQYSERNRNMRKSLANIQTIFDDTSPNPRMSRPYWDPVRLDAATHPPIAANALQKNSLYSSSRHSIRSPGVTGLPSPSLPKPKARDLRGPRARKFPCNSCSSIFERPSSLKQHKRSHTGEKRKRISHLFSVDPIFPAMVFNCFPALIPRLIPQPTSANIAESVSPCRAMPAVMTATATTQTKRDPLSL